MSNMRSCAVVGVFLLWYVSLAAAGSLNESTLQALHVVNGTRYISFLDSYHDNDCYQRDGGRASDRIVANTKEPLPDMRAMLPQLANQTILFAGDSVIRNQYVAFSALVWEADSSCWHSKFVLHSWRWNLTVIYEATTHILGLESEELGGNLARKDLLPGLVRKLSGNFKFTFGYRVPTIFCLSTNHHWMRARYMTNISVDLAGEVDMVILRAGLARINSLLRPFRNTTRIMWRSASARHFSAGEWNTGGTCNRTVPYTAEELVYHLTYGKFNPFQSMTASRVIREEAESAGYEFVDISPFSVPRADGVVSVLHHDHQKKGVIDCTHYCVPGVPDVWNTVFLDHILNQEPTQLA